MSKTIAPRSWHENLADPRWDQILAIVEHHLAENDPAGLESLAGVSRDEKIEAVRDVLRERQFLDEWNPLGDVGELLQ